uniref:2-oxoglutarate and iron-dependent oxygenase domain containing 1 n=1 Tax=Astyanax mexicanus TaxID=7994 RepID=A0A3B1JZT2_ASTMX
IINYNNKRISLIKYQTLIIIFLCYTKSTETVYVVSEVVSEGKCRLSLSGWFHGPSLPRPPRYIEEEVLFEWVNETYMDPLFQAQVQQEFEDNSEIRLPNFLQIFTLRSLRSARSCVCVCVCVCVMCVCRCYSRLQVGSMEVCVRECWDLFSSEPFFLLLSNLTGLALHHLAPQDPQSDGSDRETAEEEGDDPAGQGPSTSSPQKKNKGPPVCVGELRRWSHGDYTLLHDSVQREFALDLLLHLGCKGKTKLLTVYPEENSLALVYRDKETLKFVKHVNVSSAAQRPDQTDPAFYDFSFTYYE